MYISIKMVRRSLFSVVRDKQLPHLQVGGVGYKTTQFAPHLRNLHKHKFGVLKAKLREDKEPEIRFAVATQYICF